MAYDTTKTGPSVYISTFKKYNNGSLLGGTLYIDDYDDKDDFLEACAKLHADEESPEFMFQDVVDLPAGLIEESYLSDNLFTYLEAMADLDTLDERDAYECYADHFKNYDVDDFKEAYRGDYSERKWAQQVAEERYYQKFKDAGIEWFYFDLDQFRTDIFINEFMEIDGHIFDKG